SARDDDSRRPRARLSNRQAAVRSCRRRCARLRRERGTRGAGSSLALLRRRRARFRQRVFEPEKNIFREALARGCSTLIMPRLATLALRFPTSRSRGRLARARTPDIIPGPLRAQPLAFAL